MYRVFFLGAAPGVAQQAADKLAARYPGLQVAGVECPPFRPLSDEEERAMVERIRNSHADILLVAFGQPKGELWLDVTSSNWEPRSVFSLGLPLTSLPEPPSEPRLSFSERASNGSTACVPTPRG